MNAKEILLPREPTQPLPGALRAAANVVAILTGGWLLRHGVAPDLATELYFAAISAVYGGMVGAGKWMRNRIHRKPETPAAVKVVAAVIG